MAVEHVCPSCLVCGLSLHRLAQPCYILGQRHFSAVIDEMSFGLLSWCFNADKQFYPSGCKNSQTVSTLPCKSAQITQNLVSEFMFTRFLMMTGETEVVSGGTVTCQAGRCDVLIPSTCGSHSSQNPINSPVFLLVIIC